MVAETDDVFDKDSSSAHDGTHYHFNEWMTHGIYFIFFSRSDSGFPTHQ
jgi:hypothetical protein